MPNKNTFTKPSYLQTKVNNKELEHIVIATGEENRFIPEENKFIVTKDFLRNTTHLLNWCFSLKSIDFTDFDFSEITTMKEWFIGCKHLTEIIFPKEVNCPNLKNLRGCFSYSGITNLDLSNWHFSNIVNMGKMCENCLNLVCLKLPQATSFSSEKLAFDCKNLKTVDFPMTLIYQEREWLHNKMFENCENITLLNCEQAEIHHKFYDAKNTLGHSIINTSKDLIVILPIKNKKTFTFTEMAF